MSDPTPLPFLAHFTALRDPRQSAKVVYPLPEILLLRLCARISGANDFFGKVKICELLIPASINSPAHKAADWAGLPRRV